MKTAQENQKATINQPASRCPELVSNRITRDGDDTSLEIEAPMAADASFFSMLINFAGETVWRL